MEKDITVVETPAETSQRPSYEELLAALKIVTNTLSQFAFSSPTATPEEQAARALIARAGG